MLHQLGMKLGILLLFLAVSSVAADGGIRYYELNITQGKLNPDCSDYTGTALLVNNQLPGPAITLKLGERVRILVRNQLPEFDLEAFPEAPLGKRTNDVTIHYHGIHQRGSPSADGVPYLSQDPIPPGGEYMYDFTVEDQPGTFFYHAHNGLEEYTVFGPFIVYDREGPHKHEQLITISEWWHRDRPHLENAILGPNFTGIPDAESILLNGRTLYDPTYVRNQKHCEGYPVIHVHPGETYRLRVIGATAFRTIGLAIARHVLTVIEVDGRLVKPYRTEYLEVAPGQRFSVLLHADQEPQDYTIGTRRMWGGEGQSDSNGYAVLRYGDHEDRITYTPMEKPTFPSPDIPYWIWKDLEPLEGLSSLLDYAPSRTIKIRVTTKTQPDGGERWYVNNVTFMEQSKSNILSDIVHGARRKRPIDIAALEMHNYYDPGLGTYPLFIDEIIDFVLQSTHVPGEPCRTHPWHTHGHYFWEIASGAGEYIEEYHGHVRNFPTPFQRDVSLVYPVLNTTQEREAAPGSQIGCGWSKIRLVAVSRII